MINIPEKEPEKIKEPAEEKIGGETVEELYEEKKEELEKKELLFEKEKIVKERMEEEVEKMKLSSELEKEVKGKARQIESLDQKEKLKHLLVLAQEKGVDFAVEAAKDMKDSYILDVFHDILAKEGFYKNFQK